MDPSSAPDADIVEGSPAPQLPDNVQPTSILTETEPRVVENQTLEDLPSPEELQTPASDAYTLVIETPSEHQPRFPSPIPEETKLYDEDGKSIEIVAPEQDHAAVQNPPSPPRSIEEFPHTVKLVEPSWRKATGPCRRSSTSGLRELIFVKGAD